MQSFPEQEMLALRRGLALEQGEKKMSSGTILRRAPILSSGFVVYRAATHHCKVMLDSPTGGVQDDGVIENFKHKGLAQFFEDDDRRKLPASQIAKIGRILARLNEAITLQDMGLPGYRLHPLKGELAGFWSVTLSGNWRIIFRFENGSAYDVDLIDYH